MLARLKTLCEEAIRTSITVETVCTIFLLAHKHNAEGLKVGNVPPPAHLFFFARIVRVLGCGVPDRVDTHPLLFIDLDALFFG